MFFLLSKSLPTSKTLLYINLNGIATIIVLAILVNGDNESDNYNILRMPYKYHVIICHKIIFQCKAQCKVQLQNRLIFHQMKYLTGHQARFEHFANFGLPLLRFLPLR